MLKSLLVLALVATSVVPVLFIWNHVYNDGVLGRIGLGGVSLFSFVHLARMIDGTAWPLPLEVKFLIISCAAFLVWHLIRFHRRVLQAKTDPSRSFIDGNTRTQ